MIETSDKKIEGIYFIDVGESKISALCEICHFSGYNVCGYTNESNEFTKLLIKNGIKIYQDINEDEIKQCSILVCSSELPSTHPIIDIALDNGLTIFTEGEMLGVVMETFASRIGVAGTHGKTSVISMISHIFMSAGRDYSVICDSVIEDLKANFRITESRDIIVYEANDYKEDFLSTSPSVCVMLNLEYDHTDYYDSLQSMKKAYEKFGNLPFDNDEPSGFIIANGDDENIMGAVASIEHTIIKYGINGENLAYRAINLQEKNGYYKFDIQTDNTIEGPVKLKVPGLFNVYNALAAIAVAETKGIYISSACQYLSNFDNIKGRFEHVMKNEYGIDIYTDYSHHPKEIESVINAAKLITKGKVIVIYEPHSFRRTRDLYTRYINALSLADTAILLDIKSEYEMDTFGVSSEDMSNRIKGAFYALNYESAATLAKNLATFGDIIILMGEGNIKKMVDYFA